MKIDQKVVVETARKRMDQARTEVVQNYDYYNQSAREFVAQGDQLRDKGNAYIQDVQNKLPMSTVNQYGQKANDLYAQAEGQK